VDNNPNWKDTPANPITNTTIANRPISSTCSQFKLYQSNNTNEQFVDKLYQHFGLSDPIGEVANILDNLHMKPGNKISTYNVDFICYASQLG